MWPSITLLLRHEYALSVMDIHEYPINLTTITGFLLLLNSLLPSSGLLGQERRLGRKYTFLLLLFSVPPSPESQMGLIFTNYTKMLGTFWEKLLLPNASVTP